MNKEWYRNQNQALLDEIQNVINHGLIFERDNIKRSGAVIESTVAKYHSEYRQEIIFIGLKEFSQSSPSLQTRYHTAFASWFVESYPRELWVPSLFYGLLEDDEGSEIGMIYEDITQGGNVMVEKQDLIDDESYDPIDKPEKESLRKYLEILQVEAGDAVKIVDAAPFIKTFLLFPNEMLDIRFKEGEGKLPTVVYPRKIT